MTRRLQVRFFQVLTGLLLGGAALLWVFRGLGTGPAGATDYFLDAPLVIPEFTLATHEGGRLSSSELRGKAVAIFFGYTSCPDVCPLTLSNLARAMEEMEEDGNRIQVLLISVDPERDTPERLGQYLAAFHPSFLGLTGTEAEIREVATNFGAFFAKSGDGADYSVDHTARTFVLDPAGGLPLTFPVTATAQEMARDLAILLERSP